MPKEQKDSKHLLKEAKKDGFSVDSGFRQIAFVFDHLGASQIAYTSIHNANLYLQNRFGTNISFFIKENMPPCLPAQFAIFNTRDLRAYEGIVIGTSLSSMVECYKAVRAKKLYYIYDMEWIRPGLKLHPQMVDNILRDEKITKFTRSQDYLNLMKSNGYNISDTIVPDLDVDLISEIIGETNESSRN